EDRHLRGVVGAEQLQGGHAVADGGHLVAPLLQCRLQREPVKMVVVGQQQLHVPLSLVSIPQTDARTSCTRSISWTSAVSVSSAPARVSASPIPPSRRAAAVADAAEKKPTMPLSVWAAWRSPAASPARTAARASGTRRSQSARKTPASWRSR